MSERSGKTRPLSDESNIQIEKRTIPPTWAVGERYLIDTMNRIARPFVEKYTREDGTLIWRDEWTGMDGSDDGYESFMSFPLFYLLGGAEEVHALSRTQWNSVTRQFTEYGQINREFDAYYDWMHHGESSTYIYYFGLANPYHHMDRARAHQFADMYIGADPLAENWDAEKKMIRSPINGSRGPRFTTTADDWQTHRWILADYLSPYEDVPGLDPNNPLDTADWNEDRVFEEVLSRMNDRMFESDVPLNLNATSLVTSAFLYSGNERYSQWVFDYLDAWRVRTKKNGGICPDNVGPSGEIGERIDGKWWGGYYGWRWPHGAWIILESTLIAGANAYLLSGDPSWLDLHRSQVDLIWSKRETSGEGEVVVPFRHGDNGWFDYRPMQARHLIHLYFLTRSESDLEAIYDRFPEDVRQRWYSSEPSFGKSGHFWPERWFGYLVGENPHFPDQVMNDTNGLIQRRLEMIENDIWDVDEWDVHHWQDLNPVVPEGLVQLACGSPGAIYHGGLLHASVRYFDPEAERPGLPDSVAAAARPKADGGVVLDLINTDPAAKRSVIVRGGMFGEHRIDEARLVEDDQSGVADTQISVKGRKISATDIAIELGPGAGGTLDLACTRYASTPTYDFPWRRS